VQKRETHGKTHASGSALGWRGVGEPLEDPDRPRQGGDPKRDGDDKTEEIRAGREAGFAHKLHGTEVEPDGDEQRDQQQHEAVKADGQHTEQEADGGDDCAEEHAVDNPRLGAVFYPPDFGSVERERGIQDQRGEGGLAHVKTVQPAELAVALPVWNEEGAGEKEEERQGNADDEERQRNEKAEPGFLDERRERGQGEVRTGHGGQDYNEIPRHNQTQESLGSLTA